MFFYPRLYPVGKGHNTHPRNLGVRLCERLRSKIYHGHFIKDGVSMMEDPRLIKMS